MNESTAAQLTLSLDTLPHTTNRTADASGQKERKEREREKTRNVILSCFFFPSSRHFNGLFNRAKKNETSLLAAAPGSRDDE